MEEFKLLGQLEHLPKARTQERLALAAELAESVVVRMSVGGKQARGHTIISTLLDVVAAEGAGCFTIEEQGQEHRGRILRAAGAAGVDADLGEVEAGDGVENEVDEVVGGQPVVQVGRRSSGVSRSLGTKRAAIVLI